ncbi:deoxyribodipyrimidine photo-lyase [bacterium]|nr:deoxyribodipyrimidine photo-lyase [bacterium]
MAKSYGIHWFRRDLRITGNLALQRQFKKHDGRVLGLFCFDKKFLSRPDFSINRFQFFLNTLVELQRELRSVGSDLLVLDVGPDEAYETLFKDLRKHGLDLPATVSWSRDYEPFALARDQRLQTYFLSEGLDVFSERDHLLIEPWELQKDDGTGYQVYTPFSRKWLELYVSEKYGDRTKVFKNSKKYLKSLEKGSPEKIFQLSWKKLFSDKLQYPDHLEAYCEKNQKLVTVPIPPAGSLAANERLKSFQEKVMEYSEKRDFPDLSATSGLSPYLKNGSVTVPQIIHELSLVPYKKKQSGADVFLSELIWREFYYHILYHNPRVENEAFLPKYKNLKWENSPKYFEAWKNGMTGFPIVDAGMRQLKTTGWMHNRVRMIVASFLTKDLLIDWRWGEKYFMETLLDGDLAPNNGGWQWAASTGCDAQPYFRIFNPWLQSKRFDASGVYIKKYIPELKDFDVKKLHEPILNHPVYPAPIIEHVEQKEKALKLFKYT